MLELYEQNRAMAPTHGNETEGSSASAVANHQGPPKAATAIEEPLAQNGPHRGPQNERKGPTSSIDEPKREGPKSCSPLDGIKKIDKDKVKAALEKRRKERSEVGRRTVVMNDDDLIERELESGIELALYKKIKSHSMAMKHKKMFTICSLPQEILVKIIMEVASKSPDPIEDIINIKATCKMFHKAAMNKLVGRSIAIGKEKNMQWLQRDAYLALLHRCAECDNLDANFIIGFDKIYTLGIKAQGLEHLTRAMDDGHLNATYLLGIMLVLDIETQFDGMNILNKLLFKNLSCDSKEVTEYTRSGDPIVLRCRREVLEIAWKSWKIWEIQPRLMPCKDKLCGSILKMLWVDKDQLPRAYCSQSCRWIAECNYFLGNL